MDIFSKIKQEKSNLIDPIDLFTELSNLINEPITIVATAFIRLNNEKASVNIYPYEYDPVNGIKKSPYNHENFIEAIVNGYERVIITDEIDDHWVGFWGLSKNGQLDYDINGINAFSPFYFIREEVNDFLNLHSIPLPPCITKKVINNINDDCVNNNSKHPQQINQLEQKSEEQKKINSESVYIPPLDITDTCDLRENNQLKLHNQKLTEQLNEAKQEIEKLTKQVPILLGHHRHDDLLLLAIKTRNDIWGKYTDEDPNYKPLSSTQIKNKIKRNNPHLSDRELSSIELVACPLKRGN